MFYGMFLLKKWIPKTNNKMSFADTHFIFCILGTVPKERWSNYADYFTADPVHVDPISPLILRGGILVTEHEEPHSSSPT